MAGKGTRFLPATKQIPKEMLPIINRPMIDYAVEEAIKSGIEQIIFVTSSGKYQIEDYFDRNLELEAFLAEKDKEDFLDLIIGIGNKVDIFTVRQKEQLGLGHAINCAAPFIADGENFAVILADDLVISEMPVTKQLIDISMKYDNSPVIGVMEVAKEKTSSYGIISGKPAEQSSETFLMDGMVENQHQKKFFQTCPEGIQIQTLTPTKFKRGGREYQLTDAIKLLLEKENVYAHKLRERYDTGSVAGYLRASGIFFREPRNKSHYDKNNQRTD